MSETPGYTPPEAFGHNPETALDPSKEMDIINGDLLNAMVDIDRMQTMHDPKHPFSTWNADTSQRLSPMLVVDMPPKAPNAMQNATYKGVFEPKQQLRFTDPAAGEAVIARFTNLVNGQARTYTDPELPNLQITEIQGTWLDAPVNIQVNTSSHSNGMQLRAIARTGEV